MVKLNISEFKGQKSIDITFGEDKHFTFMASKAAALLSLIQDDLPGLTAALRDVAGVGVSASPVIEHPLPPVGNPPVKNKVPAQLILHPTAVPPTPPPVSEPIPAPLTPPIPVPVPTAPAVPAPPGLTVRFKGKDRTPTATGSRYGKKYVQMHVQGRAPGQWYALTTDTRHPGVQFARECRVPMDQIVRESGPSPVPSAPVVPSVAKPSVAAPIVPSVATPTPIIPTGTVPCHFAPLPVSPEDGLRAAGYITIGGLRIWLEVGNDGVVSGMVAEEAAAA